MYAHSQYWRGVITVRAMLQRLARNSPLYAAKFFKQSTDMVKGLSA